MTNLEIEYKTLLSQAEYKQLLESFQDIPPVKQTNHYIDTNDYQLKANKMSLRIRTFEDSAEMTLKVPQIVGNTEYNHVMTLEEAEEVLKNVAITDAAIAQQISKTGVSINDLICFGSLTTIRREKDTSIGKMALDVNNYSGTSDYELELEVDDAEKGKADFKAFLNKENITFKYAKSKVARFSNTLPNRK